MKLRIMVFVALGAAAVSATAFATPLDWTVSDVVMNDGGTVNGSFVFNATTDTYSDIDLVTTAGTAPGDFGGATYTALNPGSKFPSNSSILDLTTGSGASVSDLELLWSAPLTNAGGTLTTVLSKGGTTGEGLCDAAGCTDGFFISIPQGRELASGGTVSSVPEPATLSLLGLGLAGVGFLRRRRKR